MKKKRVKSKPIVAHIDVLQNGVSVASAECVTKKRNTFFLSSKRGELAIPYYPFSTDIPFLTSSGGNTQLHLDRSFEGFIVQKGETKYITDCKSKSIALKVGDYASISVGDLRVLLKLSFRKSESKDKISKLYKPSFFQTHVAESFKASTLSLAFLLSFLCIAGFSFFLLNQSNDKPETIADLGEKYTISFISPDNFVTAPEALQESLDRRNYIGSIREYYSSFAGLIMDWENPDKEKFFNSSVGLYDALYTTVKATIKSKSERQQGVNDGQLVHQGNAMVAIPSIVGETLEGRMLRAVDKISLMHTALRSNLESKREIQATYPKDIGYDYVHYKSDGTIGKKGKGIKGINLWAEKTDEELMYGEAEKLANKAAYQKKKIESNLDDKTQLSRHANRPVGIPAGVKFASFLPNIDYRLLDIKPYAINASTFESSKAQNQIKEPLIGQIDPKLIENYIKRKRYELQLCFEIALRRNDAARGTMEWSWRIDSRGTISNLALIRSTIRDKRMLSCIKKKMTQWKFPRPRRGSVEVSYPFEFKPAKG